MESASLIATLGQLFCGDFIISQLTPDQRALVVQNIVLSGGLAMLPGFRRRLAGACCHSIIIFHDSQRFCEELKLALPRRGWAGLLRGVVTRCSRLHSLRFTRSSSAVLHLSCVDVAFLPGDHAPSSIGGRATARPITLGLFPSSEHGVDRRLCTGRRPTIVGKHGIPVHSDGYAHKPELRSHFARPLSSATTAPCSPGQDIGVRTIRALARVTVYARSSCSHCFVGTLGDGVRSLPTTPTAAHASNSYGCASGTWRASSFPEEGAIVFPLTLMFHVLQKLVNVN